MFEFVRKHTRLLQFILLIVILPSFALFGIQGYQRFTSGEAKAVAKIGRSEITQGEFDAEYRRAIEQMRQRSPQLDAKALDTPEMRERVLDGMVHRRVIEQTAERLYLADAYSESRVAAYFKTAKEYEGIRDADGYVRSDLLAQQGMTSQSFMAMLRQQLPLQQVVQGVEGSAFAAGGVQASGLDAWLQQREVTAKRFDAAQYMAKVNPSDADTEAYYKKNEAKFRAPDQAQIEYVVLDAESIGKSLKVDDAMLRAAYDENTKNKRYAIADERRASHILVKADKDAPQAEKDKAKAKAEAILKEVRANPAAFADIAKKESQDPGSAPQGGDLDFFGRDAMAKPFEDAAFSMKVGDISNVVQTDFGFHIIKLTAVRGGGARSFEEVKPDLEAEVRRTAGQKEVAKAADDFSETVYSQAESLDPAAAKFKLEKKTATVQREPAPGATGPLASPKLLAAVFGNEVLHNKRNSQAIETGAGQFVSARVVKFTPEHTLPLAEVKDRVKQATQALQAAELARKDGEALLAELKKGGSIPDAKPIVISRAQPGDLPREVVLDILRADIGKGPAPIGVDLAGVGYAVVKVEKVVPRKADDEELKRIAPAYGQALQRAEGDAYYEALKARYKVKTFEVAAPPNL